MTCSTRPPRSAACCTAESSKQVRLLAESPKASLLQLHERGPAVKSLASTLSVLHANGANPLTRCASATNTSHPYLTSSSCTNRAPFIDSTTPRTGSSYTATRRVNPYRPSRSAGARKCSTNSPSPEIKHTSTRLRLRSKPTCVEIHPGATLGPGLFIDHATGVVIGETSDVGANVTIYQGVTQGGTSLERGKRHPSVGDRVTIGAGAKVLGPVTIGHDSRIGANAVVVKPVPANTVVVGVPGQIVSRSHPRPATAPPDLDASILPDLFGTSLQSLLGRVNQLEKSLPTPTTPTTNGQPSEAGVWLGEDFSI